MLVYKILLITMLVSYGVANTVCDWSQGFVNGVVFYYIYKVISIGEE